MVYCPTCGVGLPDHAKFCRSCGRSLGGPTTVAAASPSIEGNPPIDPTKERQAALNQEKNPAATATNGASAHMLEQQSRPNSRALGESPNRSPSAWRWTIAAIVGVITIAVVVLAVIHDPGSRRLATGAKGTDSTASAGATSDVASVVSESTPERNGRAADDVARERGPNTAASSSPPVVQSVDQRSPAPIQSFAGASLDTVQNAADQGIAAAQTELAVRLQKGKEVSRDYAAAAAWSEKAAAQGDPRAQTNLGWMYTLGQGLTRDDKRAAELFRQAANVGYPNAQDSLGWMYQHGRGVVQDTNVAIAWYRKAAGQGFEKSKQNLALLEAK
jgi:hypothetical protein